MDIRPSFKFCAEPRNRDDRLSVLQIRHAAGTSDDPIALSRTV